MPNTPIRARREYVITMDATIAEFYQAIKKVLANETYKPKDTRICPYVADKACLDLKGLFRPYLEDAEPMQEGNFHRNGPLVFRFFISPTRGVFGVFATTERLKPDGLSFESQCFLTAERTERFIITGIPMRMCACCSKTIETHSYKCARCWKQGVHVRYCGRECQRQHWVYHKQGCCRP